MGEFFYLFIFLFDLTFVCVKSVNDLHEGFVFESWVVFHLLPLIGCRVLQRMWYRKSLQDWLSQNPAMTILFRWVWP